MPIEELNLELRELGKLKLGDGSGDHPRALETWRLTSRHPNLIEAAAELYGVSSRIDDGDIITEATELEVLLPSQDVAANQWFEYWQAGGLQRRCTGSAMVDFDGQAWHKVAPCRCDEDNTERVCKPTTVLRVVLPALPDIGIWRLTTKSIYAAMELPGVAALLISAAANTGISLAPAVLGIDSRTQKRPGEPPHHFKVPVLRSRVALGELLEPGPSSSPVGGHNPTALPTIGLEEPQNGPHEAPLAISAPTGPETEPHTIWDDLAALIAQHSPDTITGAKLEATIELLNTLEELMQTARLWPENTLAGLALRWLDNPRWADSTGPTIKHFAQRVLLKATAEVEKKGLGSRALQRHRQQEETDATETPK